MKETILTTPQKRQEIDLLSYNFGGQATCIIYPGEKRPVPGMFTRRLHSCLPDLPTHWVWVCCNASEKFCDWSLQTLHDYEARRPAVERVEYTFGRETDPPEKTDPNTKLEAIITRFENAPAVKSTWRRRPIPRPNIYVFAAMFESIAPANYTLTIFKNGTFETDLGTADILPDLTTACQELESLFYTTNPTETSHE